MIDEDDACRREQHGEHLPEACPRNLDELLDLLKDAYYPSSSSPPPHGTRPENWETKLVNGAHVRRIVETMIGRIAHQALWGGQDVERISELSGIPVETLLERGTPTVLDLLDFPAPPIPPRKGA